MSDLDQAIRQALGKEDAELMDRVAADLSLPQHILNAYGGPFGALNLLATLVGVALFAGGAFSVWQFIQAVEVKAMLTWAGLAALAFAGLTIIKLWFWMELQRNLIVREIKRLEFQVARLAAGASV